MLKIVDIYIIKMILLYITHLICELPELLFINRFIYALLKLLPELPHRFLIAFGLDIAAHPVPRAGDDQQSLFL